MSIEQCGNDRCLDVYYDCDYVFASATVLPARQGGTLVQWELDPAVRDEGIYQFTLQVGNAGVTDRAAYTDVVSADNVSYLIDPKPFSAAAGSTVTAVILAASTSGDRGDLLFARHQYAESEQLVKPASGNVMLTLDLV